MKKNLLIGAVLLGAASFSMLTGFDSALTAQDVVAKCQEASLSTNEANAQAVINLDADFAVPAAEIVLGIKSAGTEKVAFTLDPLAMAAEAQITASAMGQDFGVDVSVYGITEDDQFAVYYRQILFLFFCQKTPWSKSGSGRHNHHTFLACMISGGAGFILCAGRNSVKAKSVNICPLPWVFDKITVGKRRVCSKVVRFLWYLTIDAGLQIRYTISAILKRYSFRWRFI